jgi:hypothetical protein
VDDKDFVTRPVRSADFLVILAGFFHNITGSFHGLADEFLELAVYNANRKSKVSKAWEQMTNDLETLQED